MKPIKLILICCVLFLGLGCSQEELMEKLIPKEEVEFSKRYLTLFQARDFEAIEKSLNPQLKNENLPSQLAQVAQFFPPDPPKSIEVVGSHTFSSGDKWQANLTFQYEFPSSWLLANVNLERIGSGELVVNGINVNPLHDSLANINKFSLSDKSAIHYIILLTAIILPIFIVFTLFACIRTPIRKRKWLWVVFVSLGFIQVSINWTSGEIGLNPLYFQLFGAGMVAAGKFAPWILSVSAPVGAILFWIKREKLISDSRSNLGQPSNPADGDTAVVLD